ncbi:peptide IlvX [Leclercia sp.]
MSSSIKFCFSRFTAGK